MAKIIKIKISPDNWASSRPIGEVTQENYMNPPPAPIFELTINRSDFFSTIYSWSCLPGYLSAVSGSAKFDDCGSNKSIFSLISIKDKPASCYGLLYDLPSDFTVGSRGEATIDYGGWWLKKRLEGAQNAIEMLKEVFKKSDMSLHSKWEIIEAY